MEKIVSNLYVFWSNREGDVFLIQVDLNDLNLGWYISNIPKNEYH